MTNHSTPSNVPSAASSDAALSAPAVKGRLTISPLANGHYPQNALPDKSLVAAENSHNAVPLQSGQVAKVLSSGLDWFETSIYLDWQKQKDSSLREDFIPPIFAMLNEKKELAQALGDGYGLPVDIKAPKEHQGWLPALHGWGVNGFNYRLSSPTMDWLLGDKLLPDKNKPSLNMKVTSGACWKHSPEEVFDYASAIINHNGGRIVDVKTSRIDLAVDLLIRKEDFNSGLLGHAVCRASDTVTYFEHGKLTGIGFGKGDLSCRMYDKVLEMKKKGNKDFFWALWGMGKADLLPKGHTVIRVEFQLRREALKTLLCMPSDASAPLDELEALFARLPSIWGYLTQDWLRLVENPSIKRDRQKVLLLWELIANGFRGAQSASPAVRRHVPYAKREQLTKQAVGIITSIQAMDEASPDVLPNCAPEMLGKLLSQSAKDININEEALSEKTRRKSAKYCQVRLRDTGS